MKLIVLYFIIAFVVSVAGTYYDYHNSYLAVMLLDKIFGGKKK